MNFNSIQLLRAVAALYVVLYHTRYWWYIDENSFFFNFISKGSAAVDLFFVISGFVISLSIRKYTGLKGLKRFVIGRLIRVYPIFMIIVSFFLLFNVCNNNYTLSYLLKAYLLIPSYVLHCTVSSWTLCFELYFYFLVSFLIISKQFIWLFYALVILAFISLLGRHLNDQFVIPDKSFWSIHFIAFFLGMTASKIYSKLKVSAAMVLLITGVVMFLFIPAGIGFSKLLQATIPSFFIVLGAAVVDFKGKIKIPKIIIWIGDSTYILYLINLGFCYLLLDHLTTGNISDNFILPVFIMALTGLSVVLHLFIEKPMVLFLKNILIPKK
ncbi:MAG: acyltransferase [Ferruginibacter sp.]